MPILEFSVGSELLKWSESFASPDRYVVIVTGDGEVILHPRKTSKPIVYAYCKEGVSQTLLSSLIDRDFTIVDVKHYYWDTERTPLSGV